jgi:hypothetical protein
MRAKNGSDLAFACERFGKQLQEIKEYKETLLAPFQCHNADAHVPDGVRLDIMWVTS